MSSGPLLFRTEHGIPYSEADDEVKAALRARLQKQLRANTYSPDTGDLVISPIRAEATVAISDHYKRLFTDDPSLDDLREAYAIPANVIKDPVRLRKLTNFFFWAAWATTTNRPGSDVTYTNNWPPEALVGNKPTCSIIGWSVISFVLLLAGIGGLAWYFAAQRHNDEELKTTYPQEDPLAGLNPTPSMKATLKYF